MKIAVTGATSMLGVALINQAVEQGIKVIALVNPSSSRKDRVPQNEMVRIVECGNSDYASLFIGFW